ncbi:MULTISPECIES: hypothetical protein [unclassified Nostoc]|uniref:hypothetical protein n=1 Tax=unclassified Nostoc TaxID=2593658 RepID=UPI002AD5958A|nr:MULTISPECIES: hypothetical protein [unclassified Nostoc]MDZ8122191.1 hypothetical protein [Nostoc sp. CmiVER01]MDZ8225743.1 hypothetical protein [Nostoc sp. ChiVER01]
MNVSEVSGRWTFHLKPPTSPLPYHCCSDRCGMGMPSSPNPAHDNWIENEGFTFG